MLVFEYILILLVAIFISNLINRFLPSVSVPIIQILLGALIALLPLNFKLELDPSLFFILFIAPLVFNSSMLMDKQSFWALKVPIMNLAFLLVFATVIGIGYLTHLLIPTIPLVAVFVLMAALAPTDDIAVFSVAKRVNVPPRIMNILSGESIINDASGIVCFLFAVAAVVTGTFSVTDAIGRFIILGLGGILVGLAFTLLKYALVRWIRSLGMENVTLHILIEILTPFLVFLIAETLEVSGILAIFSAGIAHSVGRKKLNPENASLNIASDSIWNVFSFTLEGLVFLILGTQLPDILRTVQSGSYPVETWEIVLYVLLITLIFALSRFVWSYCTIRKKVYHDPDHPISKFRACMIFSLSGARGAVTLASVLSIPILLDDGSAFPQRDMIILIATGVILCSLLITNFILPLFVEKEKKEERDIHEERAYLDILHHVVKQLNLQTTKENKAATQVVVREYLSRIASIQNKKTSKFEDKKTEQRYRLMIVEWENRYVNELLARNEIDEDTALHYLDFTERQMSLGMRRSGILRKVKKMISFLRHIRKFRRQNGKMSQLISRKRIFTLRKACDINVLDNLKKLKETDHHPAIDQLISEYELSLSIQENMRAFKRSSKQSSTNAGVEEIAASGFQTERDQIQLMFENNRISRETAKNMRNNIALLEMQFKE